MRKVYPAVAGLSPVSHRGVVREIFSTVHRRYDLLNRLLSLRRDVVWRRFTVERMHFFKTYRLLDVATGTGDVAIGAAMYHPRVAVTALDYVAPMMDIARHKVGQKGLSNRIRFVQGDALRLPLVDENFDVAAVAFGIRNLPDREGALAEMVRVVIPGGQVLVLEMHVPEHPVYRLLYCIYARTILPTLAGFLAPNPAAYAYLTDSIAHFPSPAAFARLMGSVGLTGICSHRLTLGITYLHEGVKR